MKKRVCITVCYHKDVEIEIEDQNNPIEIYNAVEKQVQDTVTYMNQNNWNEDEFEITNCF